MSIIVNIDVMMARRKISAGDLAKEVGITPANLSILKNGKAKAVRFLHWRHCAVFFGVSREISWSIGKINTGGKKYGKSKSGEQRKRLTL